MNKQEIENELDVKLEKPEIENELDVKIEGTQKVTDNIKEFKDYAIQMKEYYSKLVFNDDQIKEAEAERAKVNKIVKKIDSYRKNVVEEFNKPLDEFVTNAKNVTSLLKEASECIDIQIKKYQNIQKESKKEECKKIFERLIGGLKELITFESLFDERWLNKTFKIDEVEDVIKGKIEKINTEINAIKSLDSEYETELLNSYLLNFDLAKAIEKNNQLISQKKALEKTQMLKEEMKKEQIQEMITKPIEVETKKEITKTYDLRITAIIEKLTQLRKFMQINNIKFEKIGG